MPTSIQGLNPGRAARLLGAAVAIAAVGVILWRVVALSADLAPLLSRDDVLTATAACSILYGSSLFLLATGWATLARSKQPGGQVPLRGLVVAYGTSSIAKYLPGNIFHFAGRQALGGRLGLAQSSLAVASLLEATLSIVTALGLAALAILLAGSSQSAASLLESLPRPVVWAVAPALALVVWFAFRSRKSHPDAGRTALPDRPSLTAAFLLAAAFFACSGAIAALMAHVLTEGGQPLYLVFAAYLVSWVAGFVVPGAPGGIGIREGVLLALLGPVAGAQTTLALALLMRAVTTLGDAAFAGLCFGLACRSGRVLSSQ